MGAPFEPRPLPEQGFFGSLFGRVHREALIADVETTLAEADDWAAVPRDAIAAIESKYSGTLKSNALNEAILLVARAANAMTAQEVVEGGAGRLRALAAALDLSADAEPIVQSRARQALGEAAQALIADGVLSDEERVAFDQAAQACGFEPDQVAPILADAIAARMKDEIAAAIADGRLTADEEQRIDTLGQGLHARLDLDDQTRATLAESKRLWQVESGALQEIQSPIALPKTEACLYAGYGQALEPRTRGARSFTHSYGAGDIVLTSKRIIFNGGDKNIAVQLKRIVDFTPFEDGIEIRRATGKPLTFAINTKDPWFARLFTRAHHDANAH